MQVKKECAVDDVEGKALCLILTHTFRIIIPLGCNWLQQFVSQGLHDLNCFHILCCTVTNRYDTVSNVYTLDQGYKFHIYIFFQNDSNKFYLLLSILHTDIYSNLFLKKDEFPK